MDLTFYDVQNVTKISALNLGAAARHSSDDTMLRVANLSDLYQAEDVIVSITGPDAVQLWLSTDGDTFGPLAEVGDIPPGGSSATFWLRRVTPGNAAGLCTATLQATPARWSNPVDTNLSANVPFTED